jgi:DNA repair protein RadC
MIVRKSPVVPVLDPESAAAVLQELLRQEDTIDRDKEHFYCIHMNARHRITLVEVVSIGTVNASLVHPRETFRRAIHEGTTSIIVAHNHPSGDVEPSDEDIRVSGKLAEVGKLLEIPVLDHIIFSETEHFSLKQNDLF